MRFPTPAWFVFVAMGSILAGCASDEAADDEVLGVEGDETEAVLSDEGLSASADALQGSATEGAQVRTTARVNYRSGPSTEHKVQSVLPTGTAVTLVDATPIDGFYKVSRNGTTGWVHGAYLIAASSTSSGSSGTSGRRVSTSMVYLGSCKFLGTCDSYSKAEWSRNPGNVVLGCGGAQRCDDGEAFISAPRNGPPCGTVVRICRTAAPGVCTEAVVKERSDSNQRYEANPAVAEALGWNAGDRYYNSNGRESKCGSWLDTDGDARITLTW